MSSLPTPSSSWVVELGGAVYEINPDGKRVSTRCRSKPLISRPRAKSTCSACGQTGHNASNRKCPEWIASTEERTEKGIST